MPISVALRHLISAPSPSLKSFFLAPDFSLIRTFFISAYTYIIVLSLYVRQTKRHLARLHGTQHCTINVFLANSYMCSLRFSVVNLRLRMTFGTLACRGDVTFPCPRDVWLSSTRYRQEVLSKPSSRGWHIPHLLCMYSLDNSMVRGSHDLHRYQRSSSFRESSLEFWELGSVWVRLSRTFEFLCQMMTWTAFRR